MIHALSKDPRGIEIRAYPDRVVVAIDYCGLRQRYAGVTLEAAVQAAAVGVYEDRHCPASVKKALDKKFVCSLPSISKIGSNSYDYMLG